MHPHPPPMHSIQSEKVTNSARFYAETLAVEHSANTPLKDEHYSEKDEVNNGTDLNDHRGDRGMLF